MAITKTTRKITSTQQAATRRPSSITASAKPRQNRQSVNPAMNSLTTEQKTFVRQLQSNMRRMSNVTAATNTSNIMVRPDFLELLPLFVQKLYIADVFGSVAMKSRQQIIPYFKFIAENDKGDTAKGTVLSSPFVNRQGIDPNYTGRTIRNEIVAEDDFTSIVANYIPILPGSVTVTCIDNGVSTPYVDDGNGNLLDTDGNTCGFMNYSNGVISLDSTPSEGDGNCIKCTYQYDNETVGPDEDNHYGARMAKGYLQLDDINLVAEAHEMACYWSVYSAFVAQQEWGTNIGDVAKEAAIAEITAEINSTGFMQLKKAATINPQFNWDAAPVMNGSVVPSDYLNMFKLKLQQAAASIYQRTRLSRPNRLVIGSNVASYISMINGFQGDNIEDTVGPYKLGRLDQFEIYVDPNYNPDEWVMACKSSDIRRNSALFGEYMPIASTDAIGLANLSVQQGTCTMYATKIVNPDTIVSGRLLGTF